MSSEQEQHASISVNADLLEALKGMLMEWDKFTRYGSPLAKAANERVNLARSAIARAEGLLGEGGKGGPFQGRVEPWMRECFGDLIPLDKLERADRFVEEAMDLAQTTTAFNRERAHALVDYVFSRPVGEPAQEVGGVMVTLAAYCLANGLDMAAAGETELARIWTKVPQIRAKQAAKPTGSALPAPPATETGVGS